MRRRGRDARPGAAARPPTRRADPVDVTTPMTAASAPAAAVDPVGDRQVRAEVRDRQAARAAPPRQRRGHRARAGRLVEGRPRSARPSWTGLPAPSSASPKRRCTAPLARCSPATLTSPLPTPHRAVEAMGRAGPRRLARTSRARRDRRGRARAPPRPGRETREPGGPRPRRSRRRPPPATRSAASADGGISRRFLRIAREPAPPRPGSRRPPRLATSLRRTSWRIVLTRATVASSKRR